MRYRCLFRHSPELQLLAVAVVGGSLLRLYRLDEPQLWLDELIQLARIHHETLRECFLDLRQEIAATPLDYLIQRQVVTWLGVGATAARLQAAVFGCLALPCLYFTGRQFLSRKTSTVTVLLASVYPLHYFYSREARNYSLFFLLTVVSYGLLLLSVRHPRSRTWALYCLILIMLLHTNYLSIIVVLSQALLLVLLRVSLPRQDLESTIPCRWRKIGIGFTVSTSIALASFLPWLLWTYGSTQPNVENVLQDPWLLLRLFKEISGGSYPLSFLLTCLLLAGIVHLQKSDNLVGITTIACWFCLSLVLVVALDWLGGYFFSIRQVIFATPPLLFGAAAGISSLPDTPLFSKRALACLAIALILALSLGTILLSDKKVQADWNELAAFLEEQGGNYQWVIAPNVERIVAFMTPGLSIQFKTLEDLESQAGTIPFLRVIESRYQTNDQLQALRRLVEKGRLERLTLIHGFRIYDLDLSKNPTPPATAGTPEDPQRPAGRKRKNTLEAPQVTFLSF